MKNVEFIVNDYPTGIEEFAVIYNEDGSYTSMPKSIYDEMLNAPTTFPHQP
jgi:hypothetical protein